MSSVRSGQGQSIPSEAESRVRPGPKKPIVRTFARSTDHLRQPLASQPQVSAPTSEPCAPPQLALTGKRKRNAAAAEWLKATWPDLFAGRPKPLAVGIGAEITARARAAGHRPNAIGTFLHHWTQSPRYLRALAAKDSVRWGLKGTAVDFVSGEHQAEAHQRLAALTDAKAGRDRR